MGANLMPPSNPHRVLAIPALLCTFFAVGAGPKVPEGFEARLVATVPAVTFPSQVATAPDGSLFVAEDPMDQVGPYDAFHGRILRFHNGQDAVVFADGFRAIQGMAWHNGALYVSHMPFLTIIKDADGDGKAELRENLFKDLGPTNNQGLNDHIVSGIQFGIDGWLYISVGDKGVPGATRPEDGQKVQLKGGGVLRCRPDGRGLEVFSSGTRNHLDAILDDRDNVFTYDNTDDGEGWWTRVTHHIDGGYYGYPYDYHDHPDRFLPRMAEYGGGSPCGATFYKEDAWPEKYRNVGFWAEWGKGKVHAFKFAPKGASFEVVEVIDFAVADGVSDFRPIDVAVSYDGKTLYIADWGMGSWGSKTEKVGRVWAITCNTEAKTRPRGKDTDSIERQIAQLDHPSFNERMRAQAALIHKGQEALAPVTQALADSQRSDAARLHLLWTLDGIAGATPEATMPVLELLESKSPELRAQAARELGVRAVPIAVEPLVKRVSDPDPAVRLQAVIALGRIADAEALPALIALLTDKDQFVAFSARQAVRRIHDWENVAQALGTVDPTHRLALLSAVEGVYDISACRALAAHAASSRAPADESARALAILAGIHRTPRPWDGSWWGTRPSLGEPPGKVEEWEGTVIVQRSIRSAVTESRPALRKAAIAAVVETRDKTMLPLLRERFSAEPDVDVRREIAHAFGKLDDKTAMPLLHAALRDKKTQAAVQAVALLAMETIDIRAAVAAVVEQLSQPDMQVLAELDLVGALVRARGNAKPALKLLLAKLKSPDVAIRTAAANAIGGIGEADGAGVPLRALLNDEDASVRRAAIAAISAIKDRDSVPALIAAADVDSTRFEAGTALTMFRDPRVIPVLIKNLGDKNADLRKASAGALGMLRDEAIPYLEKLAARHELSPSAIPELSRVFTPHQPITGWQILGPLPKATNVEIDATRAIDLGASVPGFDDKPIGWKKADANDERGMVNLATVCGTHGAASAFGYAELSSPTDRQAQMVVGSDDTLTVWLNGEKVYEFNDSRGFEHEHARVDIKLRQGKNAVLIKCGNDGGAWQFAVAVTTATEYAFLKGPAGAAFNPDSYRSFAMKQNGAPERGRALFLDLKGLACVKCHAVAGQGGNVGPDLTGIGARYPKEELITSVLFPSQRIFSGYEPVVVATTDGRVLTGILKAETPDAIEIQDADAQKVRIPKDQVEGRKLSDVSIMPTGLAEGLSKQDFADLIAFLEGLKEAPAKPAGE
jgi:putative membrane-bound dehydrogenase-like protein